MLRVSDVTIDTVARTVWGEARSEGVLGMIAVSMVIRNRGHDTRWPEDYAEVCLQHRQFSCWNEDDPNRQQAADVDWDDDHFRQAYSIAIQTLVPIEYGRTAEDITNGANHYCTSAILDTSPPSWADLRKISAQIGRHVFFSL